MFWSGIVDDKLVRRFRILEGVQKNSENYITDHFDKWYLSIDPAARNELVFMQDTGPNHASNKTRFGKVFCKPKVFSKQASGQASVIA